MSNGEGGLARARAHSFTYPWGNLLQMLIFTGAVIALGVLVREQVATAFLASIYINSVIMGVLVVGVLYTLKRIIDVFDAAGWLKRYLAAKRFDDIRSPPGPLTPMAELMDRAPTEMRISSLAARSMLDSIDARMGEAGETTRYLGRLLVFLGLLGTFWGLLQTLGGVTAIVAELSAATGGQADIARLFQRMEEPLSGMAIAFSTSILGLAGSLVLGFLDLQANQAQGRFINEVEDWLAKISRVAPAMGGEGSPHFASALMEQIAESLDALQSVMRRAEANREAGIGELRDEMRTFARAISTALEGVSKKGRD